METRIFSKICWTIMSQSHCIENNFTSSNLDGEEDLWQNLPDTCLTDVVFDLSGWVLYNYMNFYKSEWQLYIRGLRDTMIRSKICQCLRDRTSGWKWGKVLYNVWSSFLEVRLWERRRRYQPIESLRRRSPENTGTGDEEVPLSHSLNFSSIVVFVRPSSSFSNSLLIFHPSSKWGSLMRKQTPRPPSLSPLWKQTLYNLPKCAVFLNLVLIHTSPGCNTYMGHNT